MAEEFKGEKRLVRGEQSYTMLHWICPRDDCPGEMKPSGVITHGDPVRHWHECSNCGCSYTCVAPTYPRMVQA